MLFYFCVDSARPLLEASLREEERMAAWVEANVEKVTMQYVDIQGHQAA
ncbi:ferritin family protein [Bradyrhizobium sp. LeoA1S1]